MRIARQILARALAWPSQIPETKTATAQDFYVTAAPTMDNAFALFAGEWSCEVPGYDSGPIETFTDDRIVWFSQRYDFKGRSVLELGPLEAGHTYMLANLGAHPITVIEASSRAYLKCLIVKEALNINASFLLGDFRPYVATTIDRYDFLLASGVLYHLTNPIRALADMARVSDTIGIWTHYYDAEFVPKCLLKAEFDHEMRVTTVDGVRIEAYRHTYPAATMNFCGGTATESYWLTRRSLLDYFTALGFALEIGRDDPAGVFGPNILLLARRH